MKHLIFLCAYLYANLLVAQNYENVDSTFKPGQHVAVFGHHVNLRSAPSIKASAVAMLHIGDRVEIVTRTSETFQYNGNTWPWYKVKNQEDKVGYVVGGLLAIDNFIIDGQHFLFSIKKVENGPTFLVTRTIQGVKQFVTLETELVHNHISVEVADGKGIKGVKNVIFIDYISEACGMEGGGYYLFYDGQGLFNVLHIEEIADAGVFYSREEIIFPSDPDGKPDKLIYSMEVTRTIDEATNWVEGKSMSRELEWREGALYPADFKKER